MELTSFNIANNPEANNKRKAYASMMLAKYNWTSNQITFLQKMADKGYWVGTYNEAAEVFGFAKLSNGNVKAPMCYGYYSLKPNNKKQTVTIF